MQNNRISEKLFYFVLGGGNGRIFSVVRGVSRPAGQGIFCREGLIRLDIGLEAMENLRLPRGFEKKDGRTKRSCMQQ